jgi:hypothetical protein
MEVNLIQIRNINNEEYNPKMCASQKLSPQRFSRIILQCCAPSNMPKSMYSVLYTYLNKIIGKRIWWWVVSTQTLGM